MIGSTFAVISSTGLYVNIIFWALSARGDPFYTDPLLNLLVTGMDADSKAKNLSMVLVSDFLPYEVAIELLSSMITRRQSRL